MKKQKLAGVTNTTISIDAIDKKHHGKVMSLQGGSLFVISNEPLKRNNGTVIPAISQKQLSELANTEGFKHLFTKGITILGNGSNGITKYGTGIQSDTV